MALFSTSIEKVLEKRYVSMFKSMNIPDPEKSAKQFIDAAKKRLTESAEYTLSDDFADRLLSEPKLEEVLRVLRKNGVKDEDIRWYFSLDPLERAAMAEDDDFFALALFIEYKDKGNDALEAARLVKKYRPIFGDPTNMDHTNGDDVPLPIQLKNRITAYSIKRNEVDKIQFKIDMDNSSSFNALVRKEIKTGKI